MKKFENKIVLVTGGTGGIGLATAKEFANAGAYVYFTDINDEKGREAERGLHGKATFVRHDVTSEQDWINVTGIIREKHGKLDVLVNVAGVSVYAPFEEMSLEKYMRVISINQTSVFLGLKHCISLLKDTKGSSVINIASIAGLQGSPNGAAYHSSKAAVISLTECAAVEFAPFGVRVNAISPGAVSTDMVNKNLDMKEAIDQMVRKIPLKKMADASDIAKSILYLASEDAYLITGINLIIDGGSTKI